MNFSCVISDLVAESLAKALAINSSLEELNIIDDNISDDGMVHIAKSLQENNTLKVLHVGTTRTQDNRAGLTDTGVLSLARGVAINTSIECLSIQWPLTDPESTLKMMAASVKKSSILRTLGLVCILPSGGSVPVQQGTMSMAMDKINEWFHCLQIGVRKLILSLEDSHLELLEMRVPAPYRCEFKTAVESVNSTRHKKGLPSICFFLNPLSVEAPLHHF